MRSIDFSAMGLGAWFDRRDVRQWDGPAVLLPRQQAKLARGCAYRKSNPSILVMQSAQDRTAPNASRCLGGT
jgi:hypothetical protein